MYVAVIVFILAVITLLFSKVYLAYKDKINFFVEGMNEGFSVAEINLLWKATNLCDIEEPVSIFFSMNSLTNCISQIKAQAEKEGSVNTAKTQNILSKLYTFRTKIENDADKKRGLDSTLSLSNGQKLRIILPGHGVFSSELVNNGRDLIISIPTQKAQITVEGPSWVNQSVQVYLWRKGDARYVFDTTVTGEGLFLGRPSLHLKHTTNLTRTQKRGAVRAKCHVQAELYILEESQIDYNKIETKPGYKCIIEDVSEKGALIRIGGRGIPNVQMKIQFQLENRLIIMFGIIRTVEFNAELNQSRLHFECIHIDGPMRNNVLSYVYNILPDNEKEIYEAIQFTQEDENEDNKESSNQDQLEETEVPDYNSVNISQLNQITTLTNDISNDEVEELKEGVEQ